LTLGDSVSRAHEQSNGREQEEAATPDQVVSEARSRLSLQTIAAPGVRLSIRPAKQQLPDTNDCVVGDAAENEKALTNYLARERPAY
jgi:hypothetical protein